MEERRGKLLGKVSCSGDISHLKSVGGEDRESKLLKMICYLGVMRANSCVVLGSWEVEKGEGRQVRCLGDISYLRGVSKK